MPQKQFASGAAPRRQ